MLRKKHRKCHKKHFMRSKAVLLVIITCCGWEAGKEEILGILPLYPISTTRMHWEGHALHTTHSGLTSDFGYFLVDFIFLLLIRMYVCALCASILQGMLTHNSSTIMKVVSYFPGHSELRVAQERMPCGEQGSPECVLT